jgi:hypothetical protein
MTLGLVTWKVSSLRAQLACCTGIEPCKGAHLCNYISTYKSAFHMQMQLGNQIHPKNAFAKIMVFLNFEITL